MPIVIPPPPPPIVRPAPRPVAGIVQSLAIRRAGKYRNEIKGVRCYPAISIPQRVRYFTCNVRGGRAGNQLAMVRIIVTPKVLKRNKGKGPWRIYWTPKPAQPRIVDNGGIGVA